VAYAIADRKDLEGRRSLFAGGGRFTDESVGITYRGPNEWDYPARDYKQPLQTCTGSTMTSGPLARPSLSGWLSLGIRTCLLATPFGTRPPRGQRMDAPCADIFELEKGKIKKFDCFPQGPVTLTQFGVISNLEAALAHNRGAGR
jgi:hypothetical protein